MRWTALLISAVVIWTAVLGVGLVSIWKYAHTPGRRPHVPATWPGVDGIERPKDSWTLLLALHPRCPCSRATLVELEKIARDTEMLLTIAILMFRPKNAASEWLESRIGKSLSTMNQVHEIDDVNGAMALRFGLMTSGDIALYDPSGVLRFSGGITGSRGHEGDNPGLRRLKAVLASELTSSAFPVFGCPIEGSTLRNGAETCP